MVVLKSGEGVLGSGITGLEMELYMRWYLSKLGWEKQGRELRGEQAAGEQIGRLERIDWQESNGLFGKVGGGRGCLHRFDMVI